MRGLVGERRARGARPRPQPFRAFRAPIQGRRRLAGLRRLHPTIPTHAPLPACVLVDDGRRPPRGELLALRAFEGPSRSLIHPITRRKGCRPTPPLSVVMSSRPPPPRAPPAPRVAPLPRPTAHSRLKTLLGRMMSSDTIIDLYERHAEKFDRDRVRSLQERAWLDRFLTHVPLSGSVLDAGGGMGEPIARYILEAGRRIVGIDSSPSLIRMCRTRLPGADWIVTDMRQLALGRRFDGILAWD